MTPRPSASRRALLGASAAALAAGAWPFAAHAQSGTVKFILPNATGSGVDAITRAASPALGKALNANVVVDNQPGAGGIVGLQALARSAPDGNTLAVVSNNVVIFPSVLKSLPFDMPGDFTPIAVVGATPMVLVVNPSKVQATNHKEFQAALKAKPGSTTSRRAATAPSCTWPASSTSTKPASPPSTSPTRAWARWSPT
jgi:tripartite-type tricarboxylate transporter receptor subunit TctC